MRLAVLPLASIRRPLQRQLDEAKVVCLMAAIATEGQPTILARVRQATPSALRAHPR